ncbi:hypothetical protein HYH03_017113 [Edaphochlamys debaryana]|uniref:Fungal lipase-type domain-containing protein n=1 Tax=Edaphochlamys debaryana TaxID=47281 RepID=A0A835XH73_9CHLO|nr:hypothetical protein HYH03_017113 [Edaphochlamys debaryana]|eukprot:KAG2484023.1 hypothetical protein HYH03_017113 [Edaphochlamys debaryana]
MKTASVIAIYHLLFYVHWTTAETGLRGASASWPPTAHVPSQDCARDGAAPSGCAPPAPSEGEFLGRCPDGWHELGSWVRVDEAQCEWTSCLPGGCGSGYQQVGDSVRCGIMVVKKEYCCREPPSGGPGGPPGPQTTAVPPRYPTPAARPPQPRSRLPNGKNPGIQPLYHPRYRSRLRPPPGRRTPPPRRLRAPPPRATPPVSVPAQPPPPPPVSPPAPPPASPAVFVNGAWSHTAHGPLNAYIAARVCDGVYPGSLTAADGRPWRDTDGGEWEDWFCAALLRHGARACEAYYGDTGVQYAVVNLGASVLVAFRGSDDTADWTLVNARNWLLQNVDADDASPHLAEGYARFLQRTANASLLQHLGDVRGLPVWFTGHSLGGAYAVIAALVWAQTGGTVAGVYTYGGARTGNSAFAEAFRERLAGRMWRHVVTFGGEEVDAVPGLMSKLFHVVDRTPVERYGSPCAGEPPSSQRPSATRRLRGLGPGDDPAPDAAGHPLSDDHPPAPVGPSLPSARDQAAAVSTWSMAPDGVTQPAWDASAADGDAAGGTAQQLGGAGLGPRHTLWGGTDPWVDPASPYTVQGDKPDCPALIGCHSTVYYWRSLYTCLTPDQRALLGDM